MATSPAESRAPLCLVPFIASILLAAVGCTSDRPGKSTLSANEGSGISSIHLFGVPLALDLDGKPGLDGFAVTLYASTRNQAKGIEIHQGKVELLMFDGILRANTRPPPEPARTWTFTPKELKSHAGKYALGIGYRLALHWDPAKPTSDRITVVARYSSRDGRFIASSPSTISLTSR